MEQIQNVTVEEGRNMIKKCNLAAGTSPSPFFWKKVNTSELWYGNVLNITDIRRNQRGEYSCYVNNTCGSDTTTMFIDVQCKNIYITSLFIVLEGPLKVVSYRVILIPVVDFPQNKLLLIWLNVKGDVLYYKGEVNETHVWFTSCE